MAVPEGATKTAEAFGRAVVRRKWAEILPLLSTAAQGRLSAGNLADEFGWKRLGARLRREFIAESGSPEDEVPELDPPRRYEVFEVEQRDPPTGHDPAVPFEWIEVDFLPSEDSEFDFCYNCFLAFIDEGGPRIASYCIESAME